jgi:3-hydroxy-D-aspartate aldolase
MDSRYADVEGVDFEQSLSVLTSVVSHPEKDVYICDAGTKSMSEEFGIVLTLPSSNLKVKSMSEEYITLVSDPRSRDTEKPYLSRLDKLYGSDTSDLDVGSKIHLIPSHCCTTVNLHDLMYATRNRVVNNVWRIAGRGRFA